MNEEAEIEKDDPAEEIYERKKSSPNSAPFLTLDGKKFIEVIRLRCG